MRVKDQPRSWLAAADRHLHRAAITRAGLSSSARRGTRTKRPIRTTGSSAETIWNVRVRPRANSLATRSPIAPSRPGGLTRQPAGIASGPVPMRKPGNGEGSIYQHPNRTRAATEPDRAGRRAGTTRHGADGVARRWSSAPRVVRRPDLPSLSRSTPQLVPHHQRQRPRALAHRIERHMVAQVRSDSEANEPYHLHGLPARWSRPLFHCSSSPSLSGCGARLALVQASSSTKWAASGPVVACPDHPQRSAARQNLEVLRADIG